MKYLYIILQTLLMISSQSPVDNCYDAVLDLLTCAEFIEVGNR